MGNKANRACAKVDIRVLKTNMPFLFYDKANVVGLNISGDTVYAKSMGANSIGFDNPWDGGFSIEGQVMPLKYFALLSDGTIDDTSVEAEKAVITAASAGILTLPAGVQAGSVFVYASGDWGGTAILGTVAGTTFTATTPADIIIDTDYEVGYIITKTTGVQKVSLNNNKNTQDYFVTLLTSDKDEEGVITAKKYTIFKAKPKRTLSVSHSSEGDPMTVKIEFQALEDKDGNYVDISEATA